jgi:superfamily II DNA or RNA helicase
MTLQEFLDGLGSTNVDKGRGWEQASKALLKSEPPFRERFTEIHLWLEWPECPGPDIGIDLVALEKDGSLCAIQAKHYGSSHRISKNDLDKFVTASANPRFASRLLIGTTDRIGRNARRVIEETSMQTVLLADLAAMDVDWRKLLVRPAAPRRFEPEPHQAMACREVVDGLRKRGQLLMACGTGKTFTSLLVYERLRPRRALVLVPSLSLLRQFMSEWAKHRRSTFDYIAVCSDSDVARGADEAVASTSDLLLPPSRVTSDPKQIASFMGGRKPRVVFSTYQSSPRVAEAQRMDAPSFDLVVADEAHRTASTRAGPFGTVLAEIEAQKILFQTATPRIFGKRVRDEVEVFSMDDPAIYGPVLHALSFQRAIEKRLLADYRLHVCTVSEAEAQRMIDDRELLRLDNLSGLDARTLAIVMSLHRFLREEGLRRALTFHSRVRWAEAFARHLAAWDRLMAEEGKGIELRADVVRGRDPLTDRNRKLGQLAEAANVVVLTNAKCLTEGIDVPELDLVGFVDPKRSKIDIVQALGRVLRQDRGRRKLGRVFVPLFVAPDADMDAALDASSYRGLRDVLFALREFDEGLVEQLDEFRRSYGPRESSIRLPDKIVVDDYRQLSAADAESFEQSLAIQLVKLGDPDARWWERYNAVVERGWRNVGWNTPLGKWLSTQRQRKDRGLRREFEEALDAIGFEWKPRDENWLRVANEIEAVGARNIPYRSKLYGKVNDVRQAKRADTLAPEVVARFKSIPGWEWSQRPSEAEVFEGVRLVLEASPGLPIIRLAERVDGIGRQRMSRLVRKWEREGSVKTATVQRSLRVYLPADLRDPIRDRQEVIRNYVDRNPGCSWAQLCSDLGQDCSRQARERLLGPLIGKGDVLALPRPGGERLFSGDRFTREDAIRFFHPDLLAYIRKHPGTSTTDLTARFGPGTRLTLKRLGTERVLRHTESRTRGAVTYNWYDAE